MGRGSPTVILESGFGGDSEAWEKVQPRVSPTTRICAYDRAGYGYSDPGPTPRDGEAIARDLDAGLRAAGIGGPYLLVGHSAGGLYVRLFAARRSAQTLGLVLVDPSVEHQAQRLEAQFGRGAGSVEGIQRRVAKCLEATQAPPTTPPNPALLECAPLTGNAHARTIGLRPETWRIQGSEIDSLFSTTSDQTRRTVPVLREVPVIVLTASTRADGVAAGPGDPGAAAWQDLHRELAADFRHSQHRLVQSSHLMMLDRPEVIAEAILELVRAARASPPAR